MFSFCVFRHFLRQNRQFFRNKHNQASHAWTKKKQEPIDKALAHFDDFYQQVFTRNWPGIRDGLLGKQKYIAVVNNYSDSERIMSKFELEGAINVRSLFEAERNLSKAPHEKRKRTKQLSEIYKLDREIDEKLEKEDAKINFSLEKSLETAEIDERRIVDSSKLLSTEILREFVPATKIKGREDFIPESSHYQYYENNNDFDIKVEKEYELRFPEHLNVYCFEEENETVFKPAKNGSTGVLDYYLMDGGSLMPVLALDICPGNTILDLCAAPGGKSLLALQTLYPDLLVANDESMSRTNRIFNVAKQFLYDLNERWLDTGRLKITNHDGRFFKEGEFDRVLVDVPCTTDRHSLKDNDNNIFRPSRIKERLKLPELQSELLVNGMKLVKKGGIVVYSTCSLSPIQNDGVVHMALKKIWEESKFDFVVQDLSPVLYQTRNVFKLANKNLMKYGHLIVPDLRQNYGPTYFCKLKRIN